MTKKEIKWVEETLEWIFENEQMRDEILDLLFSFVFSIWENELENMLIEINKI